MKRLIAASLLLMPLALPAQAAVEDSFSRDFQNIASESFSFEAGKTAPLYRSIDDDGYGFRLNGVMGGNTAIQSLAAGLSVNEPDKQDLAELEHAAQLSTFLLNSTYDIPGKLTSALPLRPFISGGVGVAVYDTSSANLAPEDRGTSIIPVFKIGAGLAFRMGEEMNLTVSYQVGFASSTAAGQDPSLDMININLKYRF